MNTQWLNQYNRESEVHRTRICFGFAAKVDFSQIRFITLNHSCLLKINIEDDSIMLNYIKEIKFWKSRYSSILSLGDKQDGIKTEWKIKGCMWIL